MQQRCGFAFIRIQNFERILDRYESGLCGLKRDIPAEIMQNRL
jgi:hypothetical protein